jgi:hypothetical protein
VKKYIRIGCLLVALLVSWPAQGEGFLGFLPPAPAAQQEVLVLGFMGGRNKPDDPRFGVGRFARRLREMNLPCVRVETIENTKREQALELVRRAFDRNGDRQIDAGERESTRLILYGQSFGGAAVVKFARQLKAVGIPVMLTVQIDAIGQNEQVIPSNVAAAANLFQSTGVFVHGPRSIRAEDPQATVIIGNFQFDYRDSAIDLSDLPWHKRVFQESHLRMDRDPAMWSKVEELILVTLARNGWCTSS